MAERRERETAIRELEAALDTEETDEKNFHIRQALQCLELNGEDESTSDVERREGE